MQNTGQAKRGHDRAGHNWQNGGGITGEVYTVRVGYGDPVLWLAYDRGPCVVSGQGVRHECGGGSPAA